MRLFFFVIVPVFIFNTVIKAQTGTNSSQEGRLRIASCQYQVSSTIPENARWIEKQMIEAKLKGVDIVHFPECALTGYPNVDMESLENFAWDTLYQYTDSILYLAKQLKIWVILGSIHRLSGDHKPHNSLYVINADGQIIDRYDKRFCTTGDLKHFSPGDHFVTFEVNGVRCGLLICYDIRFPELYREYRKLNVDILFQSFHNARQKKGSIHPIIMHISAQAQAATNYFYMSLTNSSTPESWPCYFILPNGLILNKLELNKPGILVSDIVMSDTYYDPSKSFRKDAMAGKLNSGETVKDIRSENRKGY